jgi:hypothetical protein
MATDIAAVRAALTRELVEVEASIAAIDLPAERTRYENGLANLATAQAAFESRERRWSLVNGIVARRDAITRELDAFPAP